MQDAVDDGLAQVTRVLGTDHHVSQLARANGGARLVDGKGQHVRGRVASPVAPIELRDAFGVDQRDRQMAVLDSRGRQGGERDGAQLGGRVDQIELD